MLRAMTWDFCSNMVYRDCCGGGWNRSDKEYAATLLSQLIGFENRYSTVFVQRKEPMASQTDSTNIAFTIIV